MAAAAEKRRSLRHHSQAASKSANGPMLSAGSPGSQHECVDRAMSMVVSQDVLHGARHQGSQLQPEPDDLPVADRSAVRQEGTVREYDDVAVGPCHRRTRESAFVEALGQANLCRRRRDRPRKWIESTGPLVVGDQLARTEPGTVTVTDITRQVLLSSGRFLVDWQSVPWGSEIPRFRRCMDGPGRVPASLTPGRTLLRPSPAREGCFSAKLR